MARKESSKAPARRDPFGEIDLFEGLGPWLEFGAPARFGRLLESLPRLRERGFAPAMDVAEDDDRYVVTVELPGASKDDVTVDVHENLLTIRGEKRSEREERKEQSHWVERRYGSFSRSFTLPPIANPDRIDASFKDGVLTIEIAKREEIKPKAISIRDH